MAQRVTQVLLSDLTNEEIGEGEGRTYTFAFDGVTYEADLYHDQAEALREAMVPYLSIGRRISRQRTPNSQRSQRSAGASSARDLPRLARDEAQRAREWWRSRGGEVADRGRLPNHIAEAWENEKQRPVSLAS